SLTSQPFQFYSCFISYSSQDDDFARRLHADLQSNKVRVWFAPEDLKIGDKILERLDHSIRIHDKLLLVLSEQSINSDWVEDEVTTAFEEERTRKKTVLFPIRLDDTVMDSNKAWAAKVRQRHIGDFTDWKNHDSYKKAFDRLIRDLKASEE
ncbi:MAG: toll/interleukin-1 receptor domain-containing protein, partial [Proteobacteria bacterium]|nr:toll/interleukin-1 receptor domain-containing protein [Pseudomonadota bacterium]